MVRTKLALFGALLFFASLVFQIGLQAAIRPYAIDQFYFQEWSSETMMQTVSLDDLSAAPLESLANIHIQPPALDTIRALLIQLWPAPDPTQRVRHIDAMLYRLWAVLYALLGLVIILWASQLTDIGTAVVATICFLLHPAMIAYATLLDGTLLSALLILIAYFLLWKLRNNPQRSVAWFTLATLALFFTRSIFQWTAIQIFAAALLLIKVPKRNLLLFLVIAGGIAGIYTLKQYYQFGIASTSSFTGLNLTRSIGVEAGVDYWAYLGSVDDRAGTPTTLPNVLVRRAKANGVVNFNNSAYLALNQRLIGVYQHALLTQPPSQLLLSYAQNIGLYFRPSSQYTKHAIVDRLPWRRVYDSIFSAPVLFIILGASGLIWGLRARKHHRLRADSALILPGLYIFLVSVLGEKGENMRFKFFLEPVIYLFCLAQLATLARGAYAVVRRRG
jgi:hypothetical protein